MKLDELKVTAWNYYKGATATSVSKEQKELYNWFILLYSPATLSAMGAEAAAEQANEAVIEYNASRLGMNDTIQVRKHYGTDNRLQTLPEATKGRRVSTRSTKKV